MLRFIGVTLKTLLTIAIYCVILFFLFAIHSDLRYIGDALHLAVQ